MKKTIFPLAIALRTSLKAYNFSIFKQDLFAALIVSLVALPLSMALAIAVGVPPQHGLYTAIVAGIVVPLLGGSMSQVTGPTAAFVVILAPIVAEFGLHGIVWSGILAGGILIGFGCTSLGRLINYVPYPVTTGFTAGIAVVLSVLSLNDFLGLGLEQLNGSFIDKFTVIITNLQYINYADASIGLATLFFLFVSLKQVKLLKNIPNAVIAMLLGIGLALIYRSFGYDVSTISSKFSYISSTGQIVAGGVGSYPKLHFPSFAPGQILTVPSLVEFRALLFPALTIAILAALESLLSATVADSISGQKHNPDAELNALGIGNILSALALGLPATGAIARTSTNIHSGGKTPISSALHAVFIMLYVVLFTNYISYIPMASLAALLLATSYRMSHYKQFYRVLSIASNSDKLVLLICFFLTVFIDMIAGVGIGMICASFLLIKRIIEITHVELETIDVHSENYIMPEHDNKLANGTIIYRIRGPLFFGTIEKAFDRQNMSFDKIKNFIVDIANVPFIDMTGLVAIKSMLASIASQKCTVHIVCENNLIVNRIKQKIYGEKFASNVNFHTTLNQALKLN